MFIYTYLLHLYLWNMFTLEMKKKMLLYYIMSSCVFTTANFMKLIYNFSINHIICHICLYATCICAVFSLPQDWPGLYARKIHIMHCLCAPNVMLRYEHLFEMFMHSQRITLQVLCIQASKSYQVIPHLPLCYTSITDIYNNIFFTLILFWTIWITIYNHSSVEDLIPLLLPHILNISWWL